MANKDYKAPLRGVAKMILQLLTQLIGLFTNRIKDPEVRLMTTGILESAGKTIDVLSDTDPNDSDQIRGVINQLFNDGTFKQGAQAELLGKIQKIDNPDVRAALTILNSNAFPVADLLTDEVPENSAQLKAHLVTQLRNEDGVLLFRSLLGIVLPATYADMLTLVIVEAMLTFLEEDEGEESLATASKLVTLRESYKQRLAAA